MMTDTWQLMNGLMAIMLMAPVHGYRMNGLLLTEDGGTDMQMEVIQLMAGNLLTATGISLMRADI